MIACPNKVDLQPVTEIANPRWIVKGTQSDEPHPCDHACLTNSTYLNQSD